MLLDALDAFLHKFDPSYVVDELVDVINKDQLLIDYAQSYIAVEGKPRIWKEDVKKCLCKWVC